MPDNNLLYLIPGILIIGLVTYDLCVTALSSNGAGIITNSISKSLWRLLMHICGKNPYSHLLSFSGLFIIFAILTTWISLIWIGNSLIFLSSDYNIMVDSSGRWATTTEKIYYTGYILSSLGIGNLVPVGSFWMIYSSFISFSGLAYITIAITYLVPVLSDEIGRKELAIYISSLGKDPYELLMHFWDGNDFRMMEDQCHEMSQQIIRHGQEQLTYPILHYFHNRMPYESPSLSITVLDEAITMLEVYVPPHLRPRPQYLQPLRRAITIYIGTLKHAFIFASDNSLPQPENVEEKLRANGIPLLEEFAHEAYDRLEYRRKLLRALVENDGWNWERIEIPELQVPE